MTSEQLLYNTNNNLSNFHPEKVADDLTEYKRSRCLHPNKVNIFNSLTGMMELREMPCGHCIHCRSIKQAEWVARAYCHCEDYKYVYFVTLTYRGFTYNELQKPINQMMINYLSDAYFVFDNENSTKRWEYSPSVLVKSHFQKFMKRLRKQTNNSSITYMMCGEYGHTYARPHAHYILYSNIPITVNDIRRAWSVHFSYNAAGELTMNPRGSKHQYKLIGRVDFHDLVINGTMTNQQIDIDGKLHNPNNCFGYVCKYVGKEDANYTRVYKAYNQIYDYTPEHIEYDTYHHNLAGDIEFVHRVEDSSPIINLKPNLYVSQNQTFDVVLPLEFYKKYAPFHEVSRGTPIGSLFAKTHLKQFLAGDFKGSQLQTEGYITPSYFRRKVAESLYGLRILKKTEAGISPNKGNLPFILGLLERNCFCNGLFGRYCDSRKFINVSDEISKNSVLADLDSGERFIVMRDWLGYCWVDRWKYDRKQRDYVKVGEFTVESFCSFWFKKLKLFIHRSLVDEEKRLYSLEQYKEFEELYTQYLDSVAEPDNDSDDEYLQYIKRKQTNYFQKFATDLYCRLNTEYDQQQTDYHLKHNRLWKSPN